MALLSLVSLRSMQALPPLAWCLTQRRGMVRKVDVDPVVALQSQERHKHMLHPWLASNRFPPSETLANSDRILTFISAHTASGNLADLERDWIYLPLTSHAEGTEIILQTAAVCGFPRVINALQIVKKLGVCEYEVVGEPPDPKDGFARGEEVLRDLFHDYTSFTSMMRGLHPDHLKFYHGFYYGTLFSRPSVPMKVRELCIVSAMAGMVVFPQFRRHLIAALNAGATTGDVRAVLEQTGAVWGTTAQTMVDAVWMDLRLGLERQEVKLRQAQEKAREGQ